MDAVTYLLGALSLVGAASIGYLIYQLIRANAEEYAFILSKKTHLTSLFYLMLAMFLTVSYQYMLDDFHPYVLLWRIGLVAVFSSISLKWGLFAKKVRKAISGT